MGMWPRGVGDEHGMTVAGEGYTPRGRAGIPAQTVRSEWPLVGQGMGGTGSVLFPSSLETLPNVPTGLPPPPSGVAGRFQNAAINTTPGEGGEASQGFACSHCDQPMKTSHGLARHVHAAHGGFGGLGKSIRR